MKLLVLVIGRANSPFNDLALEDVASGSPITGARINTSSVRERRRLVEMAMAQKRRAQKKGRTISPGQVGLGNNREKIIPAERHGGSAEMIPEPRQSGLEPQLAGGWRIRRNGQIASDRAGKRRAGDRGYRVGANAVGPLCAPVQRQRGAQCACTGSGPGLDIDREADVHFIGARREWAVADGNIRRGRSQRADQASAQGMIARAEDQAGDKGVAITVDTDFSSDITHNAVNGLVQKKRPLSRVISRSRLEISSRSGRRAQNCKSCNRRHYRKQLSHKFFLCVMEPDNSDILLFL